MDIQKILVATDFTNSSHKALRTAIAIGEKNRTHIYLLHAIELLSDDTITEAEKAIEEADVLLMFDEVNLLIDEMKKKSYRRISKEHIHVLEEEGKHEEVILSKAKELDVDLIIMGTHGPKTFTEKISGTTTDYIAKYADCSVLTVKPDGYPLDRN